MRRRFPLKKLLLCSAVALCAVAIGFGVFIISIL
jgi:hypothetical protein